MNATNSSAPPSPVVKASVGQRVQYVSGEKSLQASVISVWDDGPVDIIITDPAVSTPSRIRRIVYVASGASYTPLNPYDARYVTQPGALTPVLVPFRTPVASGGSGASHSGAGNAGTSGPQASAPSVADQLEAIRQLLLPVSWSVQVGVPLLQAGQGYTGSIPVPGVIAGNSYAIALVGLNDPQLVVMTNVGVNDAVSIGVTNLGSEAVPAASLLLTVKQL